jgi:hypothetical protein
MGSVTCFAVVAFVGCSTNVVVSRRDGALYQGAVEDSDCESVTVRTKSDDEVHRIYRKDIAYIAHPGVVHIGAGALLLSVATVLAVMSLETRASLRSGELAIGAVGYGLVGFPLLTYGAAVNLISKRDTSAGTGGAVCRDSR